jgi:hypothetical protein
MQSDREELINAGQDLAAAMVAVRRSLASDTASVDKTTAVRTAIRELASAVARAHAAVEDSAAPGDSRSHGVPASLAVGQQAEGPASRSAGIELDQQRDSHSLMEHGLDAVGSGYRALSGRMVGADGRRDQKSSTAGKAAGVGAAVLIASAIHRKTRYVPMEDRLLRDLREANRNSKKGTPQKTASENLAEAAGTGYQKTLAEMQDLIREQDTFAKQPLPPVPDAATLAKMSREERQIAMEERQNILEQRRAVMQLYTAKLQDIRSRLSQQQQLMGIASGMINSYHDTHLGVIRNIGR